MRYGESTGTCSPFRSAESIKEKALPDSNQRKESVDAALRSFVGTDSFIPKGIFSPAMWGQSSGEYIPLQQFTTCYSANTLGVK